MNAIMAATQLGGEIMGMGACLGQVRPGSLVIRLLVDGDPLGDVDLQQRDRFRAIIKDVAFWKSPERGIGQARS